MLLVRAIARGYFGSLREPGDVFEVADKAQLGRWMVLTEPAAEEVALAEPATPAPPAEQLSERTGRPRRSKAA